MPADDILARPKISVVIITYRRAAVVQQNLERLALQTLPPHQIVVVDASEDVETAACVTRSPAAIYIHNPAGAGNMTSSRNAVMPVVDGDIVAFLDDDALPRADYVARLTDFYEAHPDVSATCSRTLNGVPGEEAAGLGHIGEMTADGRLVGNFAADSGRDLEIDHGIGATMAFRRSLLDRLGGFREYYNGVSGVREDADVFLRAKSLGYQAWFVHAAVVDHIAAPQHRGQRFDRRYRHWAARNQAILMMANFGLLSRLLRRNIIATARESRLVDNSWPRAVVRAAILLSGYLRGIGVAVSIFGVGPRDPVGAYLRAR